MGSSTLRDHSKQMLPGSARVAAVKSATRSTQSSANLAPHLLLHDDEDHAGVLPGSRVTADRSVAPGPTPRPLCGGAPGWRTRVTGMDAGRPALRRHARRSEEAPCSPCGSTCGRRRPARRPDLYRAALEMAEWTERRGALAAILCEHHGMSDGYLPSPLILATAMAARTTTLPIMVAALVLPLYHPVRLAEEMVVHRHPEPGSGELRGGHRLPARGVRHARRRLPPTGNHRRGAPRGAAPGQVGRAVRVRRLPPSGSPHPRSPRAVPVVAWGGGSVAAARRAGRHGLGFLAQRADPDLEPAYRDAAVAHGHEPGMCLLPDDGTTTALFVAEDVDLAWEELGPYLMHDVTMYAALNEGVTRSASISVGHHGRRAARRGRQPPHRHRGPGDRAGPVGFAAPAPPPDRRSAPGDGVAVPAHGGRPGRAGDVRDGCTGRALRPGRGAGRPWRNPILG